jgi:hypothetical protein
MTSCGIAAWRRAAGRRHHQIDIGALTRTDEALEREAREST